MRLKRHSNPSKYAKRGKGRMRFIRKKRRETKELSRQLP